MTADEHNKQLAEVLCGIPLDNLCSNCNGSGKDYATGGCTECGGVGYTVTPLGEHLLTFFDRHRDAQQVKV